MKLTLKELAEMGLVKVKVRDAGNKIFFIKGEMVRDADIDLTLDVEKVKDIVGNAVQAIADNLPSLLKRGE